MQLLVLLLSACAGLAFENDPAAVPGDQGTQSYPSSPVLVPQSWSFFDALNGMQGYRGPSQGRRNEPQQLWNYQLRNQEQEPRRIIPLFTPAFNQRPASKKPVEHKKNDVDVSITNSSLLVDILNDLLAVKVTNNPGVYLLNRSLPVQILNPLLNVNISNTPIPVIIQNPAQGGLNTTLLSNTLRDVLSNISCAQSCCASNVTMGARDVNVTVTNDNLGVYLLNASIPVDITNATLNVNISNTPLSVIVQRQPDDLNGTTAERLLSELLSNITAIKDGSALNVTVNNKDFNVSISTLPLPVSIANETLTVSFPANATLDVSLSNSTLLVEILNNTLNVNITNTPLSVVVVRQPDDINGTLVTGIFQDILSNISAIAGGSELNVTISNRDLNVTIQNTSLLVEIANQTLMAQLTTDSQIGVYLLNTSIPVDITNATLNVNITNTPLPVLVQRQPDDINGTTIERLLSELLANLTAIQNGSPLNVTVNNSNLNVTIQNTPLNVSIANETLKVQLLDNTTVGVYLLNTSIPVDITNATLNVNITNTPLPVLVQRQPDDLNATILFGLLNDILGNLTALKNMSGTTSYQTTCPTNLGVNGASACRTLMLGTAPYCFCFIDSLSLKYTDAKSFCATLAPGSTLLSTTTFSTLLLDITRMMTIASVQGKNYLVDTGSATSCSTIYSQGGTPSATLSTTSCTSINYFICDYPL